MSMIIPSFDGCHFLTDDYINRFDANIFTYGTHNIAAESFSGK
jgi:hypothetical protein